MLSKGVRLEGFKKKISSKKIRIIYKKLLNSKSELLIISNYHKKMKKKNLQILLSQNQGIQLKQ